MDDCSCVYVDTDSFEPAACYIKKQVRARKVHNCVECGGEIQPGETYELVVAKWGEKFDRIKTCHICLSVREVFFCDGFFHGQIWDDLLQHLQDIGGQVSSECLMGLTEAARTEVCGMIQEIWNDDDYQEAEEP